MKAAIRFVLIALFDWGQKKSCLQNNLQFCLLCVQNIVSNGIVLQCDTFPVCKYIGLILCKHNSVYNSQFYFHSTFNSCSSSAFFVELRKKERRKIASRCTNNSVCKVKNRATFFELVGSSPRFFVNQNGLELRSTTTTVAACPRSHKFIQSILNNLLIIFFYSIQHAYIVIFNAAVAATVLLQCSLAYTRASNTHIFAFNQSINCAQFKLIVSFVSLRWVRCCCCFLHAF